MKSPLRRTNTRLQTELLEMFVREELYKKQGSADKLIDMTDR